MPSTRRAGCASGADDVIGRDELAAASGWRRVRFAIERRRRAREQRSVLRHRPRHRPAAPPATGRAPEPPARAARARAGADGGACPAHRTPRRRGAVDGRGRRLRRKIGVRLRAAVRASDVVAAIDDDTFAVVLGSMRRAGGRRARRRQAGRLRWPRRSASAADERRVAVALGIAHYPHDGKQAERLLRRALALAAVAPAMTLAGPAAVQTCRRRVAGRCQRRAPDSRRPAIGAPARSRAAGRPNNGLAAIAALPIPLRLRRALAPAPPR